MRWDVRDESGVDTIGDRSFQSNRSNGGFFFRSPSATRRSPESAREIHGFASLSRNRFAFIVRNRNKKIDAALYAAEWRHLTMSNSVLSTVNTSRLSSRFRVFEDTEVASGVFMIRSARPIRASRGESEITCTHT